MAAFVFAMEWTGAAVVILGGFWALCEFTWWLENRPLSPRRLLKLGKRAVNKQVTAAIRDMETLTERVRSSRPRTWW